MPQNKHFLRKLGIVIITTAILVGFIFIVNPENFFNLFIQKEDEKPRDEIIGAQMDGYYATMMKNSTIKGDKPMTVNKVIPPTAAVAVPNNLPQSANQVPQTALAPNVPENKILVNDARRSPMMKEETVARVLTDSLNPVDRMKQIQTILKKANLYSGEIDGKLGAQTKAAIMSFQKSQGLKADGVVGPRTWEALKSL